MFCKNCGKEIKDTEKFCSYCGTSVEKQESAQRKDVYTDNFNTLISPKKNKLKSKKVIIAIIAVIVALVAIVWIFGDDSSGSNSTSAVQNTDTQVMKFNLTVVNHTGIDIYELYASETDTDDWEEDVLGDNILYNGNSMNVTFTITANDLDWDFAIRDMDGAQYEYYGLSFKDCDVNGATLVLDSDGNATLN